MSKEKQPSAGLTRTGTITQTQTLEHTPIESSTSDRTFQGKTTNNLVMPEEDKLLTHEVQPSRLKNQQEKSVEGTLHMIQQHIWLKTISLLGLVITPIITLGLGGWLDTFQLHAVRSYDYQPLFWASILVHLLLAGLLLTLFWLVNYKSNSRLVAFLYLVIGLLLPFSAGFSPILTVRYFYTSTSISLLMPVSGFVTMIGLWGLLSMSWARRK